MFSAQPIGMRDYLNNSSIKALMCANDARTGMRGDPAAAAGARVCSAILAEVRDAFDLRAPWLRDRHQVTHMLKAAEAALKACKGMRLDVPVDELAEALGELVEEYEEEAQAARARLTPTGAEADNEADNGEGQEDEEEDGDAGGGAQ